MKKLSKLVAVVIAAAMAVVMCIVPASASIYDAKEIQSGSTYSCKIEEKKQINSYKIKVNSKGKVKVNITSYIGAVEFRVFDGDGAQVKCKYENKSGKDGSYDRLWWNDKTEFYKGTATFDANKGTYFIQFAEANGAWADSTLGKITFKVTTPGGSSSSSSSSVSSSSSDATIKITMDEGDKISLGALVSGKEKEVKWTSSKKSVAKVSSKGRVSAESEGTATLTAKSGGKVVATVVIEVE